MTQRFDIIDLSKVPVPDAVRVLDFDASLNAWLIAYRQQADAFGQTYNVEKLRSDPVGWVFCVAAYRGDIYLHQRVNDGVRAVLLPSAQGADLENVCADFNIVRRVITPADPATGASAVMESDDNLRARRALAPEALTTAGSYGAYRFHCLEADARVLDVGVYGPEFSFVADGKVELVILSTEGNGAPSEAVLRSVGVRLRAWEVPDVAGWVKPTPSQLDNDRLRPDTDWVIVRAAIIRTVNVSGVLVVPSGPDALAVKAEAERRIRAYCARQHRVGGVFTRDALIAAGRLLDADGSSPVGAFHLTLPAADEAPGPHGAPVLGTLTISVEVSDG